MDITMSPSSSSSGSSPHHPSTIILITPDKPVARDRTLPSQGAMAGHREHRPPRPLRLPSLLHRKCLNSRSGCGCFRA
jgi:hypothetical protein